MPSPGSPLRDALPGPLVPAESAMKRSGDVFTLAGREGSCQHTPLSRRSVGRGPARDPPYRDISARTDSSLRSITEGTEIALMARSGSLSPCPVSTHTTVEPSGTPCLINPATDAEDAASQNTDSCWARKVYAPMISSSVTAVMDPPDSDAAAVAADQLAGFPMRMAVAMVSGCSTG